jgi:hypothetical protein
LLFYAFNMALYNKVFYLGFAAGSALLVSCADGYIELNVSPALGNGDISKIELQTSATPDASDTVGTGMDGPSPEGIPQTPSIPEGKSANNEDSPSNPVPDSTPPVPSFDSPIEIKPAPGCISDIRSQDALISVFWTRVNGEAPPVQILSVKVSDPDAAAKLQAMEIKLQNAKQALRGGWGIIKLVVLLWEDQNQDGICASNEKQIVLFDIRAPRFVASRYPLSLGSVSMNMKALDDASSEESANACESKPLVFSLSASAKTERNCRIKFNRKFNTPIELALKF